MKPLTPNPLFLIKSVLNILVIIICIVGLTVEFESNIQDISRLRYFIFPITIVAALVWFFIKHELKRYASLFVFVFWFYSTIVVFLVSGLDVVLLLFIALTIIYAICYLYRYIK